MISHLTQDGGISRILLWFSSALAGVGYIVGQLAPQNPSGWAMLIAAFIPLVAAIGAQIRFWRKDTREKERQDVELEEMRSQNESLRKQHELIKKRQELTEKGVGANRRQLTRVESKLKDIELLSNVGLLQDDCKGPTIIIVDDDPQSVEMIARFIRRNVPGINSMIALDIKTALDKIEACKPQWIITDLKFDKGSGIDLILPARNANPNVKILVVTGWKNPQDMEGLAHLEVDVWTKPPSKEQWTGLIRMLQKDFGGPPPSSEDIPVTGATAIQRGIPRDESHV